jgi:hypothetical protein
MDINWTTVISSGVVAIVIGIFQLVATRYTNKILDHLDKTWLRNGNKEKHD